MDGLSFSMTLVYVILSIRYFIKEKINIVIMGATGKGKYAFLIVLAEERIFATTNYYEELTNFFPSITFKVHLVGLELSQERVGKVH
jgi:hypothetical protein